MRVLPGARRTRRLRILVSSRALGSKGGRRRSPAIRHSTRDQEFAERLHDRLLLILSEHCMSSEWVKTEIAKARKREVKEAKRVLFPVRLVGFERLRDWECFDADTGKDSAAPRGGLD
jgi:hypothetical protein